MFNDPKLKLKFIFDFVFLNDLNFRFSERFALLCAMMVFLSFYLLTYPWWFIEETIPYEHAKGENAFYSRKFDPPLGLLILAPIREKSRRFVIFSSKKNVGLAFGPEMPGSQTSEPGMFENDKSGRGIRNWNPGPKKNPGRL